MHKNIKALIIDMDGVIWKADTPIGDLPAIFGSIRRAGLKYLFATNNSTRTPEQYVERLRRAGIEAEPWQVVTSSMGAAHLLSRQLPAGSKVYMIGEDGIRLALEQKGFEILSGENVSGAQAVLIGFDRAINFQKMSEAALLVRNGIPFYATNTDRTFPTPRGEIPGAGAWISVITTATDVEPVIAGKPYPFLIELGLQILGTGKAETLVIGDRLETDIAAGQAVGCPTALVLSGVSSRLDADRWNPPVDLVVDNLSALVQSL